MELGLQQISATGQILQMEQTISKGLIGVGPKAHSFKTGASGPNKTIFSKGLDSKRFSGPIKAYKSSFVACADPLVEAELV